MLGYLDNILDLGLTKTRETVQKDVHLKLNRRECVLLARIVYGQTLWRPSENAFPDEDLGSLAELYSLFEGKWRSHDGGNACLDAIRAILCQEEKVPTDPLTYLLEFSYSNTDRLTLMIRDLLIYTDCATDGRAIRWIQSYGTGGEGEFLASLCVELINKAHRDPGDLKDPMQRCAYHKHCDGCKLCCEAISK